MASFEVSRTLMKSAPELWTELEQSGLAEALGGATVRAAEPERELSWSAEGASGRALLEPSSWGTKVILTAEVEEGAARLGRFRRLLGPRTPPMTGVEIGDRLESLLDTLGQDTRKPFARD